jgi:hypothetical protein
MKSFILFASLFIIPAFHALSQPVDTSTAKKVATHFYQQNQPTKAGQKIKNEQNPRLKLAFTKDTLLQKDSITQKSLRRAKQTLYYVFKSTQEKGFVIVSADKRVVPILAYSYDGKYARDNLPPAYKELMNNYKTWILKTTKTKSSPNKDIEQQWEEYSVEQSSITKESLNQVGPLLETKWGQGCYFNDSCPEDPNGPCNHTPTGCVATAVAQIMNYHEYPHNGLGNHFYSHSDYGRQHANFYATDYEWNAMPNSLSSSNEDIAQLLYHVGVSLNMNYHPDGSGSAFDGSCLTNYFYYSHDINYLFRDEISDSLWINKIKNEIDSLRPVYYAGGNHALVCDGYQIQDSIYFHYNFGWEGTADGYYYLLESTIFNSNQFAVINIKPTDKSILKYYAQEKKLSNGGFSLPICGDIDSDNDLDILISRYTSDSSSFMKIFQNNKSHFVQTDPGVNGLKMDLVGPDNYSSMEFLDYNNDNDLDFLLTGLDSKSEEKIKLYKNKKSEFINIPFQNSYDDYYNSFSAADYDNDGDIDIFCNGNMLRNDGSGSYTNLGPIDNLPNNGYLGLKNSISFDFDNDGDVDILAGTNNLYLYTNNGNLNFSRGENIASDFETVFRVIHGDINNDKREDILIYGKDISGNYQATIFKNLINNFKKEDISELQSWMGSDATFQDINSDGRLDILSSYRILINQSNFNFKLSYPFMGRFLTNRGEYNHSPSGFKDGGDLDKDGDLDLISANDPNYKKITIYENTDSFSNRTPSIPEDLESEVFIDSVSLFWESSSDYETKDSALSYNIYVGTHRDSTNIVSPKADLETGFRKIPDAGNTYYNTGWHLNDLDIGKYYWSVQAIDNSYKGSDFAPVDSFVIKPTIHFDLKDSSTCQNTPLKIAYEGNASDTAQYDWQFDGGTSLVIRFSNTLKLHGMNPEKNK